MTFNKRRCLIVLFLFLIVGCGKSDNVEVFPVRGTVSFKGKPMAGGGSIAFIPIGGQVGKGAGGIIASDGTYTLGTYGQTDGSMPGEFRVVITQVVVDEPENTGDGETPAGQPRELVKPEDRIPQTYANSANSPLKATVEAKDLNEIHFELTP